MYANPLGRALNKQTMHKLIQIILMGLLLINCILGAFGLITYGPPAILATTIVLVITSISANSVLSRLYGVRSDSQSALITALILALVLQPTLSPLALLTVALVGVIAQASKYVITVRGRHIFNPAAIALVIAGITGLMGGTWWIASPPATIFVLSGTFVLLYKLRLLRVGGLFIAIAGAITILRIVATGSAFSEAFLLAFTSFPIIYFAGFMLTEPTTLPPRRWQKYLVVSIVAVLFALPFSVGPFSTSPALALVIGNAIAFIFGQRRAIILRLKEIRNLTDTSKEFVFTPATPIGFQPGQYLELFIPHKHADLKSSRRSFSLTGVPEASEVMLGIRFLDPISSFKQRLLAIKPGETLVAASIGGDFVLPKDAAQKLLFIAGGIGITPFVSHIRSLKAAGDTRDIALIYFASTPAEVAYKDILNDIPHHYLTNGERLTPEMLTELVPDAAERIAYISGPPMMVDASKNATRKGGVRKIKTDYFSGY